MQKIIKFITLLAISLLFSTECFASEVIKQPLSQHSQGQQMQNEVYNNNTPQDMKNNNLGSNSQGKSVAEKLAEIKSEVVLLNAEAERAEAKKRLENAMGVKKNNIESDEEGLPVLRMIYGNTDNRLKAEFKYNSDEIVDAYVGSPLPGHFKVVAITPRSAKIQDANGQLHIIVLKQTLVNANVTGKMFSSDIPAPRLR